MKRTFLPWVFSMTLLTPLAFGGGAGAGHAPKAAGKDVKKVVKNGWNGKLFDYERLKELVVEETTPSPGQVDWHGRPRQMRSPEEPKRRAKPAAPRAVGPMDVVHLKFRDVEGEVVPALLCTPRGKKGPFPVVVAVHGLTSNKAQVTAQVGPALAGRGFAVLAVDLPRHGERPGEPLSVLDASNPAEAFKILRQAVNDVRQCIDLAEGRPELDTSGGVVLAGYSLGSWVNAVAGPADSRVRAMVLMVGGAHEIPAAALLLPQVAAGDPRLAMAHFAGRPVLVMSAKRDYVVSPEMSKRLFAACCEPKKQVWYDCGHILGEDAYEDAAEWVEAQVKGEAKGGARKKAG